VVVEKTFRYSNVFLLQPLIPQFLIPEHNYEKRYKNQFASWPDLFSITASALQVQWKSEILIGLFKIQKKQGKIIRV